ncbi:MAG: Txe/YoeB family addiction module toxin [Paludibacteraceae bacterium]|nr:Txe/YoeB family addiction module toxin [Paludibacteraceae bacterium]
MYVIRFSDEAQRDLLRLQKKAPQAMSKFRSLLKEVAEHPRTGTGQAERLKHYKNETWSRRITKEHRLIYEIHDEQILVLVISSFGHYE